MAAKSVSDRKTRVIAALIVFLARLATTAATRAKAHAAKAICRDKVA
jgi:hypothetical protein